jgi:hypothetical protein
MRLRGAGRFLRSCSFQPRPLRISSAAPICLCASQAANVRGLPFFPRRALGSGALSFGDLGNERNTPQVGVPLPPSRRTGNSATIGRPDHRPCLWLALSLDAACMRAGLVRTQEAQERKRGTHPCCQPLYLGCAGYCGRTGGGASRQRCPSAWHSFFEDAGFPSCSTTVKS